MLKTRKSEILFYPKIQLKNSEIKTIQQIKELSPQCVIQSQGQQVTFKGTHVWNSQKKFKNWIKKNKWAQASRHKKVEKEE